MARVSVEIPEEFRRLVAGRPPEPDVTGDDWLRSLPTLIGDALARWALTPAGTARFGYCALVLPVRREDGSAAALKVGWPHPESRHEHLALRAWDGHGAAHLLAADPATSTMLLEFLEPDRDLEEEDIEQACVTIGTLLARLDRPALPQLDRLSDWAGLHRRFDSPAAAAIPRRFLQQARSGIDGLLEGVDVDARLVHTDLHYENVLAGPRGWTAIDPKPMAAEPAFGVWPALHNRWEEAAAHPAWEVHCRLGWICEAAGIDEDRARAWALVRTVVDAIDAASSGDAGNSDLLTARITLAKALAQRF